MFPIPETIRTFEQFPGSLPRTKCVLIVDYRDLPLSKSELQVFRELVGPRAYPPERGPNFTRLTRRQRTQRTNIHRDPYNVRFMSDLFPTTQMNENRCFQMLDETIRQSKILAEKFLEEEKKEGRNEVRKNLFVSCRPVAIESIVPQTKLPRKWILPKKYRPVKTKKANSVFVGVKRK